MATISLQLAQKPYGFIVTDESGNSVKLDNIGTQTPNFGVSPMQSLLMALAGCSSIDVLLILEKQKQDVTEFKVNVSGNKEKVNEFSLWKEIDMELIISGTVDEDKAKRAAQLSIDKYCSVAETLRRAGATITYKVTIQ
ncbi:MAG: OsmC family protein [Chitinophagaceae bacterium]|nr:OsmC family protein [Chitinophagaceae bacterium]